MICRCPAKETGKRNTYLAAWYDLEIVDVVQDQWRALDDHVLVTPTLFRLSPPVRKIIGDLNEKALVLVALGVKEP